MLQGESFFNVVLSRILALLHWPAMDCAKPRAYPPLEIFNWWDKAQHAIGYVTLMVTALLKYPNTSKLHLAA